MISDPANYVTDEHVALRAPADFCALCPRDQSLAFANDGSFDSSDPWTLRSNVVDFEIRGIRPGCVVKLSSPILLYPTPGDLFAVALCDTHSIRLRRLGHAIDLGQPPSPAGGITGVEFQVTTLGPQIAAACRDVHKRLGIDDQVAGRGIEHVVDVDTIRDIAVLTVLYRQYLAYSRANPAARDDFAAKAAVIKSELEDQLARVVVHWKHSGARAEYAFPYRFGTRVIR